MVGLWALEARLGLLAPTRRIEEVEDAWNVSLRRTTPKTPETTPESGSTTKATTETEPPHGAVTPPTTAAQVAAPEGTTAPTSTTTPAPKPRKTPQVRPSKGQLRFVELGTAVSVHREGYLRIHADLSGLYHFIQEASHHYSLHMKHGELQRVTKTSANVDQCVQSNNKWSLLSPLSSLATGSGWTPGRLNDTLVSHQEPHEVPIDYTAIYRCLYPDETSTNITEGEVQPPNITHARQTDFLASQTLGGLDHYSYDLASQIAYGQLNRCARALHQQLERFSYPTEGPRNVRQLMMLLGLGGLAFGIANSVQLWGVQSDLSSLGAEVRGYADESRALGRTVAAFIEHSTDLSQALAQQITQSESHIIRTRSLLQLTVITSAACGMTDDIIQSLNDLRSQRFPTNLFTEQQNERFMNELTESLRGTGLEPAIKDALFLHLLPAGGAIVPRDAVNSAEPVPSDHLGSTGTGIITSFDEASNTTTLKVKMTSRVGGSTKISEITHKDHAFKTGFVTNKHKGVELVVVSKVPLKKLNDPGFSLVKLDPTMIALNPADWAAAAHDPDEDLSPESVRAQLPGGVLRAHGALGEHFLTEVTAKFLGSCRRVGGTGPFLCSQPVERPAVECLMPLLNKLRLPSECLDHFEILNATKSYIIGGQAGPVQVSLATGHQLRTYCPGQEKAKVEVTDPGLYEVDLPANCLVFAGKRSFIQLAQLDLTVDVVQAEEIKNLERLELIRDVQEKTGWRKLKALRRELKGEVTTLRDLHDRLTESFLHRVQRTTPHASTYFWLAIAALVVFALILISVWVYRRGRRALKEANAGRRADANKQMTIVYGHLNRHDMQLNDGYGPEVQYRPVEGRPTAAVRELNLSEVLLPMVEHVVT